MRDIVIMIDKWPLPRFKRSLYSMSCIDLKGMICFPIPTNPQGPGGERGELEPRKDAEMEGRGHLQIKEHEA